MPGIRISHVAAKNVVYLVPIVKKPFLDHSRNMDPCPSCHLIHPCKTVHLWLDAEGTCIVSAGVLADLQSAGMPDLLIEAEIPDPPPLAFGGGAAREQIDNQNRRIVMYTPIHK